MRVERVYTGARSGMKRSPRTKTSREAMVGYHEVGRWFRRDGGDATDARSRRSGLSDGHRRIFSQYHTRNCSGVCSKPPQLTIHLLAASDRALQSLNGVTVLPRP